MNEEEWLKASDPHAMLNFLRGKGSDRKMRLFALSKALHHRHVPPECRDICDRLWDVAFREAEGQTQPLTEEQAELGKSSELEALNAEAKDAFDFGWTGFLDAPDINWADPIFDGPKLAQWAARDLAVFATEPNAWEAAELTVECWLELSVRQAVKERLQTEILSGSAMNESESAELLREEWLSDIAQLGGADLCASIRDIFGNPFRSVKVDPSWLTLTVTSLAQAIYDDRNMSGTFNDQRMSVLADSLEEAGCDNRDVLDHCRGNGNHVRGCWLVDLILQKE